ncbi:hypothetical protein GF412_01860 [Candidatus Micrarchaeota archaeon]|nr:hypothetical protein [Candidatus Micrarchaeota archaeon]MBD3417707.1 hypothetical protein [Candidatus Micrarchaeota archaeon]
MKFDAYSLLPMLFLLALAASVLLVLPSTPPDTPLPAAGNATESEPKEPPPAQPLPPSCSQVSSCSPGDGCCPDGCTAITDIDCPAAPLGETLSLNGLQLQADFLEERRCIGFSDSEDYSYYLVFETKAKNTLNRSQFVSYPRFYLLDAEGYKHSPDSVLPYYSCRDNYQELLLDTKYLQPGQAVSGEVWIQIDKETDPIHGTLRLVYDPLPSETGDEFIYSFQY